MKDNNTFLTATWRRLAMLNWAVPAETLEPYLPAGTELDFDQGECYISLVGFMFLNTRVMGVKIPSHVNFEEINLRFYVKRKASDTEIRRGVVFIRELVPKPAIAWIARVIYAEKYYRRAMQHRWLDGQAGSTAYSWKPPSGSGWLEFSLQHSETPHAIPPGSHAEFITEHYWGYARLHAKQTVEYEVRHPKWQVYEVNNFSIQGDFVREYGAVLGNFMKAEPRSVLLAEGSEITVQRGKKLF